MPTPDWKDLWDRKVAGLQLKDVICVGSDFLALPHELYHFVREGIEGDPDSLHTTWTSSGMDKVDQEFVVWIKSQKT